MAIDFEKARKKLKAKTKKDVAKWNKANPNQKINRDGVIKNTTKSAKVQTAKRNVNSLSARYGGVSTKDYKVYSAAIMNQKAKKTAAYKKYHSGYKGLDNIDKAAAGLTIGFVKTLVPTSLLGGDEETTVEKAYPEIKKSKLYKGSEIAGDALAYATGYKLAGGLTGKGADKIGKALSKTSAGKALLSKAAKSKLMKSAARKTLSKAGKAATVEAVEAEAKKKAANLGKLLLKDAVADATVGTALNANSGINSGLKGKDLAKYMAQNAALDFGIGGAIDIAPTVIKAASKGGTKTISKVVNGKVKNVKVSNAEYNKMAKAAKDATKDIDISDVTKTKKTAPAPKSVKDARTVNRIADAKKAKIKAYDELLEKEVKDHAEAIKNYQKQGTTTNFTPDKDRMDLGWDSDSGFGYSTRSSNNDQWYQEFYKEYGRPPTKSEAEQIAREHIEKDLWYYDQNPSSVGDMELGASDELKKLRSEIKDIDEYETFVKDKLSGKSITPETRNKIFQQAVGDKEFLQQLDSYGDINTLAEKSGKSVDDFVLDEYVTYRNGRIHKDIGADSFRPSTQDINTKIYGEDRGVPNATPYGETSQAAKTLHNSPMMDETAQKIIQQDINDGIYAKYTKSNKTAMDNAIAAVDKDMDAARKDFDNITLKGRAATSEDIATGYRLAQNYQKAGDYDNMMKVLADVASMESEAGRTLQAMRMFNNLTPEAKAISVTKQINRVQKATGTTVKAPTDLIDQLSHATDEATANRIQKQIMKDVWSQIPASWTQKANAWRYMCMLANPKTHVRNILGNALFVPIKGMRNMIASGLEKAIVKNGNRTKAILTHSDRNLVKAGKNDFKRVKDAIMNGSSRYIESGRDLDATVFKNKAVEWARRNSGDLLEKEDEFFMGYSYERAYAQYLKANGVKDAADAGAEMLNKARNYAINEALNSTYRDASALADYMANMKKYSNVPLDQVPGATRGAKLVKKTGSMLVDATIPFTKTPINIMRRGWDYSPGGLIQGMGKILKAGGDNAKLIEGIAKVSSGLTGTGIVGLGLYMGMHDMAQGSLDTTTAEGAYAAQNGEQEYSIRVGDSTYTMDWAAPISMPFFIGVELGNDFEKNGFNFASVLSSMKGMTDPIFNLSMLSGLNNALDTAFDDNATLGVLGNITKSYIGQYFPTLGGQIARTLTSEKRTTTSTADNKDVRNAERFLNQIKNKTPFVTDTNQPYVDLWGNTEKKTSAGDYLKSAFDNLISPGTLKSTKQSTVDKEINKLGERLGDMSDIVPKKTNSSEYNQKFGDDTYHMNEADLTSYNKAKGQYAEKELRKLFSTNEYKNMSDEEKKKAIKSVYDDAKDNARMEFLMNNGVSKEDYKVSQMGKTQKKAYKASGMDIDEFEKLYKTKKTVTDSDGTLTSTMKYIGGGAKTYKQANAVAGGELSVWGYENARNLYTLGFTPKEIAKVAKGADADGNKHFTKAELIAYLETTNYSRYEKAYIFQAFANKRTHNPYA